MSVIDEVRAFVGRLAGAPVCDDCIAERLDLRDRQQQELGTRELAADRDYERKRWQCSLCGANTIVISKS